MIELNLTDDGFEPFSLVDDEPAKFNDKDNKVPDWAVPYLCRPDAWDNFSDDLVYEIDKRMREWLERMKSSWSRKGSDRRYQFSDLLDILGIELREGRRKNYMKISRIFAYYSTKIQKETTINGKKRKNVYTVSAARLKRQPYSLRLRLEQLNDTADGRSFRLPVDDLEPGHARNKRTEANMERRRQEAKRRFNEYQQRKRSESRASEVQE